MASTTPASSTSSRPTPPVPLDEPPIRSRVGVVPTPPACQAGRPRQAGRQAGRPVDDQGGHALIIDLVKREAAHPNKVTLTRAGRVLRGLRRGYGLRQWWPVPAVG